MIANTQELIVPAPPAPPASGSATASAQRDGGSFDDHLQRVSSDLNSAKETSRPAADDNPNRDPQERAVQPPSQDVSAGRAAEQPGEASPAAAAEDTFESQEIVPVCTADEDESVLPEDYPAIANLAVVQYAATPEPAGDAEAAAAEVVDVAKEVSRTTAVAVDVEAEPVGDEVASEDEEVIVSEMKSTVTMPKENVEAGYTQAMVGAGVDAEGTSEPEVVPAASPEAEATAESALAVDTAEKTSEQKTAPVAATTTVVDVVEPSVSPQQVAMTSEVAAMALPKESASKSGDTPRKSKDVNSARPNVSQSASVPSAGALANAAIEANTASSDFAPIAMVEDVSANTSAHGAEQKVLDVSAGVPAPAAPADTTGNAAPSGHANKSVEGPAAPLSQQNPLDRHLASNSASAIGASGTRQLTDVEQARLLQRVSRAMQTAVDRGGEIRLRLSPPELGSLKVEIIVKQGVLNARLEAETSAARSVLLENLPVLRERLAEQNIKIDRFDVDVQSGFSNALPDRTSERQESGFQGRQNRQPGSSAIGKASGDAGPTTTTNYRIARDGRLNVIV